MVMNKKKIKYIGNLGVLYLLEPKWSIEYKIKKANTSSKGIRNLLNIYRGLVGKPYKYEKEMLDDVS